MSLIKMLRAPENGDRGKVYWNRALTDGAPFRGERAPMLREAEFEEATHRVYDSHVEVLDVSKPEERAKLESIIDNAANGWFHLHHMERQFVPEERTWLVLIMYSIPFQEMDPNRKLER